MNDDHTRGVHREQDAASERAWRGATDAGQLELVEGLQAQIDDLTRTVERHQAILEQLTSDSPREV